MAEAVGIPRRRVPALDPQYTAFLAVLLVVALFVLYPVLVILVDSFVAGPMGTRGEWSLAGWREALSDPTMLNAVANTVKVLVANESITLPTAVLLAWLLARTDLPL